MLLGLNLLRELGRWKMTLRGRYWLTLHHSLQTDYTRIWIQSECTVYLRALCIKYIHYIG